MLINDVICRKNTENASFLVCLSFTKCHEAIKSGNGGGFVFDCRAMPNPYWDESLRGYTCRDKPIADFFARHKDKVDCFLGAAETLVRQSIGEYLKDGRDHLQVAFGCREVSTVPCTSPSAWPSGWQGLVG